MRKGRERGNGDRVGEWERPEEGVGQGRNLRWRSESKRQQRWDRREGTGRRDGADVRWREGGNKEITLLKQMRRGVQKNVSHPTVVALPRRAETKQNALARGT